MANPDNKKLLILYVLEILKDYSDEDHPLLQKEIADKIFTRYGMDCERKAVAANINCLEEFGYDIERIKNKGVYLGEREFEPSEIAFLVDSVFSSKIINAKQSRELAEKLYRPLSIRQRKTFNYIYKADEISRTDNNLIFYNIEVIKSAIEQKKKVEFDYNSYTLKKETETKKRVVSPYFMINSQGKYYLVGTFRKDWGLTNFRIERMTGITVSGEKAEPIESVKGYENGVDIAEYANENIYAFGGESVKATLRLTGDYIVNAVYEWFDDRANVYERNGEIFATVCANERALIYWCMQYGESVELLSPEKTRKKLCKIISSMKERYEKNV